MAKKVARTKKPTVKDPVEFPVEGTTYRFETLLELVQLLQHINNECALKGKWKYQIFIFPCFLDEARFFLGCQYGRVYITRNSEGKAMYRPEAREVLAKYYNCVPTLVLKEYFWAYNFVESLPLEKAIIHVKDPGVFQQVANVIEYYIEGLEPGREKRRTLRESGAPPWAACSICSTIPNSSYGFWKGGELESGGIPASEQYLYIVGGPKFNDNTSYRHWCVKVCPECATCYLWKFDYEFLAGGSEDEVDIQRLDEKDAKQWKEKIFESIRASKDRFEASSLDHITTLKTKTLSKDIRPAIDYFYHEQLVNGHDITMAIPALVHALAHHRHLKKETSCPGFWITSLLGDYARKTRENREKLLEVMGAMQDEVTSSGQEFRILLEEIATINLDSYDLY